ncbi:MAG: hypothetical protein E6Q97_33980 [Desulfurellales bacterium]|nr:MAG: hypothetical protein E6Q97_33980 [Desulfurellales bacterium]
MTPYKHPPLERLLELIHEDPTQFRTGFDAWVANNQGLFTSMVEQAFRVQARGVGHYSIGTIWEVVRHMAFMEGRPRPLNNNWRADAARLMMLAYPMLNDMFVLKDRYSHRLMAPND